jgi:hypothetical protein
MGGPQAFPFVDIGDEQPYGVGADVDGTDPYRGLGRG